MAIASINPATGETIREFSALSAQQLEQRLQLAAETFRTYRRTSFTDRSRMMLRTAEILESDKQKFGETMTMEMGKPLKAAIGEAEKCAWVCRYYAENAERHLADQIVAHLKDRPSPKIAISDERDAELETGGGVKRALPLLGDGPFLLRNSDSFWLEGVRPNLHWLAGGWDDQRMDGLLLLASTVKAVGYSGRGDFTLDPAGRIARRQERRIAPFVYAGAAIFSPRLFADAPDGRFSLNVLFDQAIEAKRLFGVRLDGLWISVENPRAVDAATAAIAASAA